MSEQRELTQLIDDFIGSRSPNALRRLRTLGDAAAAAVLARVLTPDLPDRHDADQRDQWQALIDLAIALANDSPGDTVDRLSKLPPERHLVAAQILAGIESPMAAQPLMQLSDSKEALVRWAAVLALGHHSGNDVRQAITARLTDRSSLVRNAAADSIEIVERGGR